jgi:hypothetical protein
MCGGVADLPVIEDVYRKIFRQSRELQFPLKNVAVDIKGFKEVEAYRREK